MKDLSVLDYKIYAHRGFHSEIVTENTKEAFKIAIERNYPIELDVRLTKDKTVIVFHDRNLKRLYDINEKVKDYKYKKLSKASSKEISKLTDILNLINGKVPVIIEVKKDRRDFKLEKELVKILDKYNGSFAVKSFNKKTMLWFKRNREEYVRGLLVHNNIKTIFDRYRLYRTINKLDLDFISVNYRLLNKRYIRRYGKNMKVLAWTIKNSEVYSKYKNLCDGLICENIDQLGCD